MGYDRQSSSTRTSRPRLAEPFADPLTAPLPGVFGPPGGSPAPAQGSPDDGRSFDPGATLVPMNPASPAGLATTTVRMARPPRRSPSPLPTVLLEPVDHGHTFHRPFLGLSFAGSLVLAGPLGVVPVLALPLAVAIGTLAGFVNRLTRGSTDSFRGAFDAGRLFFFGGGLALCVLAFLLPFVAQGLPIVTLNHAKPFISGSR